MTTYRCPSCSATLTPLLLPVPVLGTQRTMYRCLRCDHRCGRCGGVVTWTRLGGWTCGSCRRPRQDVSTPREVEVVE